MQTSLRTYRQGELQNALPLHWLKSKNSTFSTALEGGKDYLLYTSKEIRFCSREKCSERAECNGRSEVRMQKNQLSYITYLLHYSMQVLKYHYEFCTT